MVPPVSSRSHALAWGGATALGILAGVSHALSPFTTWFLILASLLVVWAGRGLVGRERAAVMTLIGAALAARALALTVFVLATDHSKVPYGLMIGDEMLIQWRALWLRNIVLDVPIAPTDWIYTYQEYGESGLVYAFALLHALFGPSPYSVHLFNILLYVAGAIVLFKVVRPWFGAAPSSLGLALVLWLPSLFIFSMSALKESAYFFLTSVALASTATIFIGRRWWMRVLAVVPALLAANAVATIRSIGWIVTAGGMAVGIAARIATWRAWLCVGAVAFALLVGYEGIQRPDIQERLMYQFRTAAVTHIGNVGTQGYGYKTLDPYFYTRWWVNNDLSFMVPEEAARYALRSIASFATVPKPWQMSSRPALVFLPEMVVWYLSIVFAFAGVVAGLRRNPWLTWLLFGYIAIAGSIISLPSGNIGTFIRMRDMVVPFVLFLGALGFCAVAEAAVLYFRPRATAPADDALSHSSTYATAR